MFRLKAEAGAGDTIEESIREAIELSKKLDCGIQFLFNDIHMYIVPQSTVKERLMSYENGLRRRRKLKHLP